VPGDDSEQRGRLRNQMRLLEDTFQEVNNGRQPDSTELANMARGMIGDFDDAYARDHGFSTQKLVEWLEDPQKLDPSQPKDAGFLKVLAEAVLPARGSGRVADPVMAMTINSALGISGTEVQLDDQNAVAKFLGENPKIAAGLLRYQLVRQNRDFMDDLERRFGDDERQGAGE